MLLNSTIRLTICFLSCLFAQTGTTQAASDINQYHEMSVNFQISSIQNISNKNETFEADFYIRYTWVDQSLDGVSTEDVNWSEVSIPKIESINSDSFKQQYSENILELIGPSKIRLTNRYKGVFKARFNLLKFPFDTQTFPIVLESYTEMADTLAIKYEFGKFNNRLALDESAEYTPTIGKHISKDMHLSEWQVKSIKLIESTNHYPFDGTNWSQLRIEVDMSRKFGFYVWNIILVIVLISFLSWSIFFLDRLKLSDRLRASMSLFLSAVAFSLVTVTMLPKIPYMTLLDYFMKLNFLLIMLTVIESLYVCNLAEKNEDGHNVAKKIDRYALILFPILFISCSITIWIVADIKSQ